MKTFVRGVAAMFAVAALCQAGLAVAEDFQWVTSGTQATANDSAVKTLPQGGCAASCDSSCGDCGSCLSGCECGPTIGVLGIFGVDSFKGPSDGPSNSNFGAVTGLNAAMPIPGLSDYGIGWQLGMTGGVYDWDGYGDRESTQQQTFVTTGFYRKAGECQRLSFGMVYDWMLNKNWGYADNAPTLGQWRGQVEYAVNECNGFGMYGCMRDRLARWDTVISDVTTVTFMDRSVSHADMFWHHKFACGADSRLWLGVPEQKTRVNGDGTLYDWIIGANVEVPLNERLALYVNAEYAHASGKAGSASLTSDATASYDSTWNIGTGVVWYFGGHAVSHSLNGKCWTPYMPVANNSTFLVDQGTFVTID